MTVVIFCDPWVTYHSIDAGPYGTNYWWNQGDETDIFTNEWR